MSIFIKSNIPIVLRFDKYVAIQTILQQSVQFAVNSFNHTGCDQSFLLSQR